MEMLMTTGEVVKIAFANSPGMEADAISEATVLTAQQKFIKPVVGKNIYKKLEDGKLDDLLEKYVKPALAYCIKILTIPTLTNTPGNMGIIVHKGNNFTLASDKSVTALKKQARSEAGTFLRLLIEHIEDNRDLYPEYVPEENVLNRLSISSGAII